MATNKKSVEADALDKKASEWYGPFGNVMVQLRVMRYLTMVLAASNVLLGIVLAIFVNKSSVEVYVAKEDPATHRISDVQQLEGTVTLSREIIEAQLEDWVVFARIITPDGLEKNRQFEYVQARCTEPVRKQLEEYFGVPENNPSMRAAKYRVQPIIKRKVWQSDQTLRVEWEDVIYDKTGSITARENWWASMSYAATDKRTPGNILGVYVTHFDWSKF